MVFLILYCLFLIPTLIHWYAYCTQEDVVPYYEAYHCFANLLKKSKLKVCWAHAIT